MEGGARVAQECFMVAGAGAGLIAGLFCQGALGDAEYGITTSHTCCAVPIILEY